MNKKEVTTILTGFVLSIILVVCIFCITKYTSNKINIVDTLISEGDLYRAYQILDESIVQDSSIQKKKKDVTYLIYQDGVYQTGKLYVEYGDYTKAILEFNKIPDYLDSSILINDCLVLLNK